MDTTNLPMQAPGRKLNNSLKNSVNDDIASDDDNHYLQPAQFAKEYVDKLSKAMTDNPSMCSQELKEIHENAFEEISNDLTARKENFENPNEFEEFYIEFERQINEVYKGLRERVQKSAVNQIIKYIEDETIRDFDNLYTPEDLQKKWCQLTSSARENLQQETTEFQAYMYKKLASSFSSIKEKFRQHQRDICDRKKNLIEVAMSKYKHDKNWLMMDKVIRSDSELRALHDDKVYEAEVNLRSDSDQQTKNHGLLDDFRSEVSNEFDNILTSYQRRRPLSIKRFQDVVSNEYDNEMSEVVEQVANVEDLRKMHARYLREAVKKFQKFFSGPSDPLCISHIGILKNIIQATFDENVSPEFENLLGEQDDNFKHGEKEYCKEMNLRLDTNCFLGDNVLRGEHNVVRSHILLERKIFSPEKVREFDCRLEILYSTFVQRNDMNYPTVEGIGIDLGTTYSCVAIYEAGCVKTVANGDGLPTTPSYVRFNEHGHTLGFGDSVKEGSYSHSESVAYDAKRMIGREFSDPELQKNISNWPFAVVNDGGEPKIKIFCPENSKTKYTLVSAPHVASELLKGLRSEAEKRLNLVGQIKSVVITVPAYFTEKQITATKLAGEAAGLRVLEIISEPVAAVIAYNKLNVNLDCKYVLTFDLGGGTFDVAVVKMAKGKSNIISQDGHRNLGGEDFDQNMMQFILAQIKLKHGTVIISDKGQLQRLKLACEKAKKVLSSAMQTAVKLDCFKLQDGKGQTLHVDLDVSITRDQFEDMNKSLFQLAIQKTHACLEAARVDKGQIKEVVMVGGSTRIPKVQAMLKKFFGNRTIIQMSIDPDQIVAHGAAMRVAMLTGSIRRGSPDYQHVTTVTQMSYGVEVWGGDYSVVIPKNTPIPNVTRAQFRTANDQQTSVLVSIFQGEAAKAVENHKLGDFYLNGIPPAEANLETIEVMMEIDTNRVLHVSAACVSNGVAESRMIEVVEMRI
ncbi:ribosome-associated molecular chaperone sks2 [Folsomia candida]|uniref:Heat shock 70 kDa protein n=1 Tax=Folsomia candida TaxID=158441 RepID=A0A226D0L6_FOLCA|nr:ribosome-associated molecular chaperone sks2 [Folsomia candida]XP_035700787.1 ribosome-associated molecular chaperone sks2 [Folsomia candida]XP_035700788.1 ribosome-associated molecular chaperone sks2 [Folsomia candida]OXA38723.1 hypothetical protein Fcan01_26542 [Folsomia candida]